MAMNHSIQEIADDYGYPPQPVDCQWLTERDKDLAPSAEIIRLIVDDQRGYPDHWSNEAYQRYFLRDIQDFIGPSKAVLVTHAGALTVRIRPLVPTLDSLRSGLSALQEALIRMEKECSVARTLWRQEMLVGVDGCENGQATHLQTVVHLKGAPVVSLLNTIVKLYPTGREKRSLIGWRICETANGVPDELAVSRRVQTAVGTVFVLVCNDATPFSDRSRSKLGNDPGKLRIRGNLIEQVGTEPPVEYIVIATHYQGTSAKGGWAGETFLSAAKHLSEHTEATVVTTMCAPRHELSRAAKLNEIMGPRADKVATLLVRDTWK
jgi:hypothetical protein